jgi:hypothetical protein
MLRAYNVKKLGENSWKLSTLRCIAIGAWGIKMVITYQTMQERSYEIHVGKSRQSQETLCG